MHSLSNFDEDSTYVITPLTADNLCTFTLLRSFMDRVKDGDIKIKSAEFPAFLYSSTRRYDPQNRSRGLLRGETLLRVSAD
jgi:hypothetical protein